MTTRFDELSQRLTAQADLLYMISDELDELNDLAQQKDLSSEELLDAGASFLTLAEMIDSIESVSKSDLHDLSDQLRDAIIIAGALPELEKVSIDIETTPVIQQIAHKPELPDVDDMTPEQIQEEIVERLMAILKGDTHPPLLTTALPSAQRQPGWPDGVHLDVAQFPFPEKLFEAMKASVLAAAGITHDLGNLPAVIQLRNEYFAQHNINPYSACLILMALVSLSMHEDSELQCPHCVLEHIAESAKLGDETGCMGMVMTLWGHLLVHSTYMYYDVPKACEGLNDEQLEGVKLSFFKGNVEEAAQAVIFTVSRGLFSKPAVLDRHYLVNFFDCEV